MKMMCSGRYVDSVSASECDSALKIQGDNNRDDGYDREEGGSVHVTMNK